MWLPTKKQIDTATRYATVAAGTAFTLLGLQAKGISLDQLKAMISALGDTASTIVQLLAVAGALYASVKGTVLSSPTNQIQSVNDIAQDSTSAASPAAKVALLQATTTVLNNPQTAPTGAEAHDVKTALLDATAAIPEVVGKIAVTDPLLAIGTVSNQVQAVAQ